MRKYKSLAIVKHIMNKVKDTVAYLNQRQIPVIAANIFTGKVACIDRGTQRSEYVWWATCCNGRLEVYRKSTQVKLMYSRNYYTGNSRTISVCSKWYQNTTSASDHEMCSV